MPTTSIGFAARLFTAAALLNLAGSRADADVMYQVTDLGWDSSVSGPQTGLNAESESQSRPVRIAADGSVTNEWFRRFDPAKFTAIQSPYPIGRADLFPAVGDSHYQSGFIAALDSRSAWQAVVWDGQTGRALGPPPPAWGQSNYGMFSMASGVNDAGHAVGAVGNNQILGTETATSWGLTSNGTDPLAAFHAQLGSSSHAFGINNHDQIVGAFQSYNDPRAFLFTGNKLIDLNTLIPAASGWTLLSATGINDQGQIVGYGTGPAGNLHRFLLTPKSGCFPKPTGPGAPSPVPEPTTLASFIIGFGGWAIRRYLRRKA